MNTSKVLVTTAEVVPRRVQVCSVGLAPPLMIGEICSSLPGTQPRPNTTHIDMNASTCAYVCVSFKNWRGQVHLTFWESVSRECVQARPRPRYSRTHCHAFWGCAPAKKRWINPHTREVPCKIVLRPNSKKSNGSTHKCCSMVLCCAEKDGSTHK